MELRRSGTTQSRNRPQTLASQEDGATHELTPQGRDNTFPSGRILALIHIQTPKRGRILQTQVCGLPRRA